MFVNVIKSYRDVVAICDKELLGKTFEEPSEDVVKQLDIKESFYKGQTEGPVTEEEALQIMKRMADEDATFNIVGEKAVNAAIKAEIITDESIGRIQDIPFALVLI